MLYCGSFNNIKSEPICISNGVNTTLFNIEAKHLELPENIRLPENFGILYGSLTEWQGIKKIVQSLESDLWQKSIHVVFIGKGKEVESALIKISAEKNKHIHYYENIDYRIIARIIARAKFSFVCGENINNRASHGLAPLKLFESIACGVPIIATNQPFQSEVVIENNLGLVLAELNNLNIFNAVTYLVNNPLEAQKMGSNGARCAKLYYGWDKKAEQTNSYLENLCLKFHS